MNNRWFEYIVNVTVKINRGTFGIKYERLGEFRFCSTTPHEASLAAAQNVRPREFGETVMTEIVSAVSV